MALAAPAVGLGTLRRLAELETAGVALSVYLDSDCLAPSSSVRQREHVLDGLLGELAPCALPGEQRRLREIVRSLPLLAYGTRGVALFSCAETATEAVVALPCTVAPTAVIDTSFWLEPIAGMFSCGDLGVLVLDRGTVRLFRGSRRRLVEFATLSSEIEPRLRRAAGADRRRAHRAARRGQPRHARVLPRARPDHQPADRRARLHRGGGRGRLARCLPRQPLRPRRRRGPRRRGGPARLSRASRPGCGATPTCSTSSAGCAPTTSAAAHGRARRLLRPRPLQPRRLDGSGDRLPRRGRPRGRRGARARARYECLHPFAQDSSGYGEAVLLGVSEPCRRRVLEQLVELRRHAGDYLRRDGLVAEDEYFFAEQNATVVADAEEYYRTMFGDRAASWNLRDRHMADTLDQLLAHLDRHGGAGRRSSCGSTTRTSATRARPRWASAASSTSAS